MALKVDKNYLIGTNVVLKMDILSLFRMINKYSTSDIIMLK